MRLLPHSALLLGLAWFAFVNAALSALVCLLAPILVSRARRSGLLLSWRLLAAAGSTLFVCAVFLPAHWRFEPGDASDSFGVTVYALAGWASGLLVRSFYRAARVTAATRALRRAIQLRHEAGDPTGCLPGFNGVSLAGVLRTHILVGDAAREALSADEMQVALAHEVAHRHAYDNLKRVALYCAPDLLSWSAAARALEQAWHVAAEKLADARAVRGDASRATNLASALIKVARLGAERPLGGTTPAWSTLHDPPLLETRVRRLLDRQPPSAGSAWSPATAVLLFSCVVAALGFAGASSPLVHNATEWLVRILP